MARAAVALALALGACDAASSDPGLSSILQVADAQYRPGPFPDATGGPATLAVFPMRSRITIDEFDGELSGVMEPAARGAIVGIAGVDGAWIIPAGSPEIDTPESPAPRARFGVTSPIVPGPFELIAAAVDAEGRIGERASTTIVADEEPPPDGTLVIGLYWQGAADLELHVVDPDGGEAWTGDPNTYVPPLPGEPPDPKDAYLRGGILNHDGNRECHRDAHPSEHVVWTQPPPPGDYVVRVDARSMCGDAVAYWYVVAEQRGLPILGKARGVSTSEDTLGEHRAGAGTLALQFQVLNEP